jgi:hypothetical protein
MRCEHNRLGSWVYHFTYFWCQHMGTCLPVTLTVTGPRQQVIGEGGGDSCGKWQA